MESILALFKLIVLLLLPADDVRMVRMLSMRRETEFIKRAVLLSVTRGEGHSDVKDSPPFSFPHLRHSASQMGSTIRAISSRTMHVVGSRKRQTVVL